MPKVSDGQVMAVAKQVGFPDPIRATAIAIAENGGTVDTDARNVNSNHTVDYGAWQCNSANYVGDVVNTDLSPYMWNDLLVNGTWAKQIFDKQGFNAWVTYKNGSYLAYMPRAIAVKDTPAGTGSLTDKTLQNTPLQGLGPIVDGLKPLGDFSKLVSDSHTWVRVGMFVGGIVLGVVGVLTLNGKSVGKIVGGVI